MPAPTDGTAFPAFRHEAPNLATDLVPRPRLGAILDGRFERRLTVLVAGPGFGKTTALAQAVLADHPDGALDVWLRLDAADADPAHLLAGLARSIAGTDSSTAPDLHDIIGLVWNLAPRVVALVLDDAGALGDGRESWDLLARLLEDLPTNAHVVVSSRVPTPLPVSRMQAEGIATVIDQEILAFTADELDAFARAHDVDPELEARLPSWPALAVLTAAVGHESSVEFLWDEVVAGLDPERRELLAGSTLFDVVDDDLLDAIAPSSGWTTARLFEHLPLVDGDRLGSCRLHALWGDALRTVLDPEQRRTMLRLGAESFLRSRQFRRAVVAFADADDEEGLVRAVRAFSTQPIAATTIPDVLALLAMLPPHLRDAPVGQFLHAASHWATDQHTARAGFEATVRAAEETGDREIESLARWRLVQLDYLDDHSRLQEQHRMVVLAEAGVPLGASTLAFVRSVMAQHEGRVGDALEAIEDFDGFDPDQRQVSRMGRLIDLGRPEAVAVSLDSVLEPGGLDLFGAQAVWLRGVVDPETAWAISQRLPGVVGRKGVVHEQVTLRCVVATIALAAGADQEAANLVAQARGQADAVGRQVQLIVTVAEALVALALDGEDAAREQFARAVHDIPLGRWPARAYLHGLAAARVLVPGAESLDTCGLGPALQVAVDAGRALVGLRADDRERVRMLPWDDADLLRCQVPAPMLAELALARSLDSGSAADQARAVLDSLPNRRRSLERVAARGAGRIAADAKTALTSVAERPPYDLAIRTLGPLTIERSDGVPVDESWTSRERVRQLLTKLLLVRRANRATLAAELWPDLPADKAAANLRVNLRHLQRVLQPDRPSTSPSWFLRTVGTSLELASADEGLEVDVDGFDELINSALRAEADGMPSVALAEYQAALGRYGGDFLEGFDQSDLLMERLRLRSMAHGARCRCGELTLAQGEPGAAIREATDALRLDPLSERAHRLFIRCQLAMGSTSAARSAGTRLLAELDQNGLRVDDETRLLLQRLDL